MLKRYHQASKQREKQRNLRDNPLYNATRGFVSGAIVGGALEGTIGSLAIPTSVRRLVQKLPKNYKNSFTNTDYSKGEKIFERFYNFGRIPSRLIMHGLLFNHAMNDLSDGGNLGMVYAITTTLSVGLEAVNLSRWLINKRKHESVTF